MGYNRFQRYTQIIKCQIINPSPIWISAGLYLLQLDDFNSGSAYSMQIFCLKCEMKNLPLLFRNYIRNSMIPLQ